MYRRSSRKSALVAASQYERASQQSALASKKVKQKLIDCMNATHLVAVHTAKYDSAWTRLSGIDPDNSLGVWFTRNDHSSGSGEFISWDLNTI